jgi:hypothetical protein
MNDLLIAAGLLITALSGALIIGFWRFRWPRRKRVNLSYLHVNYLKRSVERLPKRNW